MELIVSLLVNIFMAGVAYVMVDRLLSSQTIKDKFIKANLFGKDLNKASEDRV